MNDELGKMPDATVEEPELHPGGVDSIDDPKYGSAPGPPIAADADPADNPAMAEVAPDELSEPDDKQQASDDAATLDSSGDETGEPEPPA